MEAGREAAAGPGAAPAFTANLFFLLLSNLLTLAVALWTRWSLWEVMWVYWFQSAVIGWFNLRRMLALKQYSSAAISIAGRPLQPTAALKWWMSAWFGAQYGVLHAFFLGFLIMETGGFGFWGWFPLCACSALFFFNHRASFLRKSAADADGKTSLALLFVFPYARVVPMFVVICRGAASEEYSAAGAALFMLLKTFADAAMSVFEYFLNKNGR